MGPSQSVFFFTSNGTGRGVSDVEASIGNQSFVSYRGHLGYSFGHNKIYMAGDSSPVLRHLVFCSMKVVFAMLETSNLKPLS